VLVPGTWEIYPCSTLDDTFFVVSEILYMELTIVIVDLEAR